MQSICCKIFKVCPTILEHNALKGEIAALADKCLSIKFIYNCPHCTKNEVFH